MPPIWYKGKWDPDSPREAASNVDNVTNLVPHRIASSTAPAAQGTPRTFWTNDEFNLLEGLDKLIVPIENHSQDWMKIQPPALPSLTAPATSLASPASAAAATSNASPAPGTPVDPVP